MIERSRVLQAIGAPLWHGFGTRALGPWQSAVQRAAEHDSLQLPRCTMVRQVHGHRVLRSVQVTPESEGDAIVHLVGDGPGVVAVRTADCVPILLADQGCQAVAAIHSGWRGTLAGIVGETIAALQGFGLDPSALRAAIGPCIEWPAFEVGEEVAECFPAKHVHRRGHPKPRIDLVAVVREQLLACGLPQENIERVGGCTHAHPERYFSYRRDGGDTGHQMSFIGLLGS